MLKGEALKTKKGVPWRAKQTRQGKSDTSGFADAEIALAIDSLLADKGYDSDDFRADIIKRGGYLLLLSANGEVPASPGRFSNRCQMNKAMSARAVPNVAFHGQEEVPSLTRRQHTGDDAVSVVDEIL